MKDNATASNNRLAPDDHPMFNLQRPSSKNLYLGASSTAQSNQPVLEHIHYVTPDTYPRLKKFLKEGETFITDEELRNRKKKRFLQKFFYKKLCALVDRIHQFEQQYDEGDAKMKKDRRRDEEKAARRAEKVQKKVKDKNASSQKTERRPGRTLKRNSSLMQKMSPSFQPRTEPRKKTLQAMLGVSNQSSDNIDGLQPRLSQSVQPGGAAGAALKARLSSMNSIAGTGGDTKKVPGSDSDGSHKINFNLVLDKIKEENQAGDFMKISFKKSKTKIKKKTNTDLEEVESISSDESSLKSSSSNSNSDKRLQKAIERDKQFRKKHTIVSQGRKKKGPQTNMIERNLTMLKQQSQVMLNLKTITESASPSGVPQMRPHLSSQNLGYKSQFKLSKGSTMINIRNEHSSFRPHGSPDNLPKKARKMSSLLSLGSSASRNFEEKPPIIITQQSKDCQVVISEISSSSKSSLTNDEVKGTSGVRTPRSKISSIMCRSHQNSDYTSQEKGTFISIQSKSGEDTFKLKGIRSSSKPRKSIIVQRNLKLSKLIMEQQKILQAHERQDSNETRKKSPDQKLKEFRKMAYDFGEELKQRILNEHKFSKVDLDFADDLDKRLQFLNKKYENDNQVRAMSLKQFNKLRKKALVRNVQKGSQTLGTDLTTSSQVMFNSTKTVGAHFDTKASHGSLKFGLGSSGVRIKRALVKKNLQKQVIHTEPSHFIPEQLKASIQQPMLTTKQASISADSTAWPLGQPFSRGQDRQYGFDSQKIQVGIESSAPNNMGVTTLSSGGGYYERTEEDHLHGMHDHGIISQRVPSTSIPESMIQSPGDLRQSKGKVFFSSTDGQQEMIPATTIQVIDNEGIFQEGAAFDSEQVKREGSSLLQPGDSIVRMGPHPSEVMGSATLVKVQSSKKKKVSLTQQQINRLQHNSLISNFKELTNGRRGQTREEMFRQLRSQQVSSNKEIESIFKQIKRRQETRLVQHMTYNDQVQKILKDMRVNKQAHARNLKVLNLHRVDSNTNYSRQQVSAEHSIANIPAIGSSLSKNQTVQNHKTANSVFEATAAVTQSFPAPQAMKNDSKSHLQTLISKKTSNLTNFTDGAGSSQRTLASKVTNRAMVTSARNRNTLGLSKTGSQRPYSGYIRPNYSAQAKKMLKPKFYTHARQSVAQLPKYDKFQTSGD